MKRVGFWKEANLINFLSLAFLQGNLCVLRVLANLEQYHGYPRINFWPRFFQGNPEVLAVLVRFLFFVKVLF
jgi:hypothetical protein